MRSLLVLALMVLMLGACSADKGFGEAKKVTSEEFGALWPLTVDSVTLNCDDGWISVFVEGEGFRIDDVTGPGGVDKRFLRYWATDESQDSRRRDVTSLIEEGETLCH